MATHVKICGTRRREDALVAAEAGAHAVGVICDPTARRYVSPAAARDILAPLPDHVARVGVFVDAEAETIRAAVEESGLTHVQLHGAEPMGLVEALAPLPVVRVIRRTGVSAWRAALLDLSRRPLANLRAVLLDTPTIGAAGGTGRANDWRGIGLALSEIDRNTLPPLILAGGLTPDTVGTIVRDLRPDALDVSSGVETTWGEKNAERVTAFVEAVSRTREAAGQRDPFG